MKNRKLGTPRIIRNRDIEDLSKKESEQPEYMKKQRFTDGEIELLKKKLKEWKAKNP